MPQKLRPEVVTQQKHRAPAPQGAGVALGSPALSAIVQIPCEGAWRQVFSPRGPLHRPEAHWLPRRQGLPFCRRAAPTRSTPAAVKSEARAVPAAVLIKDRRVLDRTKNRVSPSNRLSSIRILLVGDDFLRVVLGAIPGEEIGLPPLARGPRRQARSRDASPGDAAIAGRADAGAEPTVERVVLQVGAGAEPRGLAADLAGRTAAAALLDRDAPPVARLFLRAALVLQDAQPLRAEPSSAPAAAATAVAGVAPAGTALLVAAARLPGGTTGGGLGPTGRRQEGGKGTAADGLEQRTARPKSRHVASQIIESIAIHDSALLVLASVVGSTLGC